jgi:hypothetical protein
VCPSSSAFTDIQADSKEAIVLWVRELRAIGLAFGLLHTQSGQQFQSRISAAKSQIDDTLLAYLHECTSEVDLGAYMLQATPLRKRWTGESSAPSSTLNRITGNSKARVAFCINPSPPSQTYVFFPNDDWRALTLLLELRELLPMDTRHVTEATPKSRTLLAIIRKHKEIHKTRTLFQTLCDMLEWIIVSKKVQDTRGTSNIWSD